ncbi:ABC-type transport system periplasmic substrate-binding protein (probable substrate dipeptide/oligopeptide) (plasmid) [Natrialba magadii ATCC 43099]|uniref:ABC-type transport system periplasmic substrate-binding protein (Probable substrate dipeptide/oligopeptide) n=1 Tax=Natrialba magadii (strain ATCC 43099 / DSM 3394 / CCM 3739 / CIP 104546 / IAM 13178 / JCM 8861 / NBRC 102185 / NCIMB 2190 / MS3) TaxID=547559 RepID=D3T1W9_NATMM|nr:ABC transporter substrate-binding protein [Natrialba magadii]ADD07578.1 ABC-type transport system periplasmic substrate-binding protein (probable substrate dipeptide/oligopeptide) [Natrialba magadii ATCC 43099]ELY27218.1 family 5 extracellular solute-binding protein [Natrialba magadii ATCC 43099]
MEPDGNMQFNRRELISALSAGGVLALAGCADQADGDGNDEIFVDALDSDPGTLDLHETNRVPESMCLTPVHERLFTIDPDLEPQPWLATEYETNDDETEYVIQLEEGVEFHDGTEFNADVAKWNLERAEENSPDAWQFGTLEEIDATGDYELTFHFEEPHPLFPQYLANVQMGFASREAVEAAGDDYGQEEVVGTGPLVFEEWVRDDEIVYSRNEDYDRGPDFLSNDGPINFEEYHVRIVPEPTTLLNEVTVGNVDGSMMIAASDAEDVEAHDNTQLERVDDAHPTFLSINVEAEPTDEVEVRQAMAYAVDQEAIVNAAFHGEGYPIYSLCPPMAVGGLDEATARETGYEQDLDTARELLDDAGWENDEEGEVRTRNGDDLSVSFFAFEMEPYSSIGEVTQDMLSQVGFEANLEILESGTLYDRVEGGEHNLVTMALSGGYIANNTLASTLHSQNYAPDGGSNYSLYQSDEYDEIIDQAEVEPDDAEREALLHEAQEHILEEVPVVPLVGFVKFYAAKNEISVDAWTDHPWWPSPDQYNLHAVDVDRS